MSYQNQFDVTLKFDEVGLQEMQTVRRVIGLVKFKQIIQLINELDLQANPRNSRVGPVTAAITRTLQTSPELFPAASKGLVLAARNFRALDRGRFELQFVDRELEGILDGGHNLLAIGLFVLDLAVQDEAAKKAIKKIKRWDEFKEQFTIFRPVVREFMESDAPELNYQVSAELILPKSSSDLDIEEFESSLFEIQEARNNNAQLEQGTKSNKRGYYDDLKKYVSPEVAGKIQWKTNEAGDLKVADLIALTWIPLLRLDFRPMVRGKYVSVPSRVATYAQKGSCVARFDEYMSSEEVTMSHRGVAELRNEQVRSALRLMGVLPEVYDLIERKLPEAYNASNGRYGAISAVEKLNQTGKGGLTRFTEQSLPVKSPAGFIAPLIFSSQALMRVKGDGTLEWEIDPLVFFENHLDFIVGKLKGMMAERDVNNDPQKVGKKDSAYEICLMAVENMKSRII